MRVSAATYKARLQRGLNYFGSVGKADALCSVGGFPVLTRSGLRGPLHIVWHVRAHLSFSRRSAANNSASTRKRRNRLRYSTRKLARPCAGDCGALRGKFPMSKYGSFLLPPAAKAMRASLRRSLPGSAGSMLSSRLVKYWPKPIRRPGSLGRRTPPMEPAI